MMQMVSFLMILVLMGCASPSPGFLGAARQDVTVEGMRFAVYARATEAQVIRLDRMRRPDRGHVAPRMLRAAEQATGCRAIPDSLIPVGGTDSAVGKVGLRCPP
ncbi:hypothetical protein E4191_09305 [Paracoccus liaowanqingii]|uniref:Lipoprotein n=1 Tax=Paracoccus liaowanqingii TaxID=2560053 RepID=A0A4P7HL16_9RHOB|nr:hypothetical protein [Paracoccus liaowanqingii]QBX34884.1 hypothetical protein E4191_09305 [Paracoccus liaowanqingii]